MPLGIVKAYNSERGFGFIEPQGGGPQLFFHVSELERPPDQATDILGARVGYDIGPNRSRQALIDPNKTTMAIKLRFV
jgi:CspA family cold shock protein